MQTILLSILVAFVSIIVLIPSLIALRLYFHDKKQEEHAILRNYPVLGKARYIIEKMGPELRQYLYNSENEGKPFNRRQFVFVNKAGKYNTRMIGYGSQRDFEEGGYYLKNALFPTLESEMKMVQEPKIETKTYQVDKERLFDRKEHNETKEIEPYYLSEDNEIVLGENTVDQPFRIKGLIGQSGMSFGSLGDRAITTLSKGLGMAGGTWMNTGEGSLSPYHLKGNTDIIMQIGPGLFGVRTKDGEFSWEEFRKQADHVQVKAFELKLGQGAKTRGGHVDASKVTEEIAEIRNVEPHQDIDSPNRFHEFNDVHGMMDFIDRLREAGGKPVGIKIVIGNEEDTEGMIRTMSDIGNVPDFITVDGGEGGTGASYYELADSVGLPAFSALPFVDDLLKEYGIRDQTHVIASGKLLTPDKIAMALCLGADMVNIARGFMISTGCIMSQVCHTNNCPVGVATTDPELQKALEIEEKKYRVCNYLITLRQGLFTVAAAAGIDSPTKFSREHIHYQEAFGKVENDPVQHR
ncbi:FMN-binding glutamate synthase family protein [Salimicrobium halophilum]|uniref:Glutamate synthase domain-containing protein 2 n=1 Tax=Salimicrobium halophilum TaxID=86666 RepID=A0A1G8TXB3_9BACI|nr:FMN-binding glutamate synthase family protein [Salimicrobium halophilum]SDJ46141.1 Glutamate synthase domain-containing protein 2 [Salimicrobium halophilum]